MRRFRPVRLRGLTAGEQSQALDSYFTIDALHEQVLSDLQTLQRQGYDVSALAARHDTLLVELGGLRTQLDTLDSAELGSWEQDVAQLRAAFSDLLDATIAARSRASEGLQVRGLLWGLGAAAVAAGGAWLVWRSRRRRR